MPILTSVNYPSGANIPCCAVWCCADGSGRKRVVQGKFECRAESVVPSSTSPFLKRGSTRDFLALPMQPPTHQPQSTELSSGLVGYQDPMVTCMHVSWTWCGCNPIPSSIHVKGNDPMVVASLPAANCQHHDSDQPIFCRRGGE